MKQAARNSYARGSIAFAGMKSVFGGMELQKMQNKLVKEKNKEDSSKTDKGDLARGEESTDANAKETNSNAKGEGNDDGDDKEEEEEEIKLSEEDEKKLAEKMSKTLNNVILIMWRVTELDIRSTIAKVCKKVTHDHSVDKVALQRRLRGLRIVGESYIKLTPDCSSYGASAADVTTMMQPILSQAQGAAPPDSSSEAS